MDCQTMKLGQTSNKTELLEFFIDTLNTMDWRLPILTSWAAWVGKLLEAILPSAPIDVAQANLEFILL